MKEIFGTTPFYNDFHALVYLESDNTAKIVMNEEAVKSVIQQMVITRVINSQDYTISRHVYKMNITLLELQNSFSVGVIRKDYIWGFFQSTGVIVVVCNEPQRLQNFLQKTFLDKIK